MRGHTESQFHSYPTAQVVTNYLVIPMMWLFWSACGAYAFEYGRFVLGTLCVFSALWLIVLNLVGSLLMSSIAVNDEGIAANNFGRTLKFVSWGSVTKVKKVRRWNMGSRTYEEVFHVFDGEYSPLRERFINVLGPVVFSHRIGRVKDLLDSINVHAQRYGFPLVVIDQGADRSSMARHVETRVTAL